MKRISLFFYVIIVFIFVSSFSLACDWDVSIISDNIFENESSFSFKYRLTGTNKTNITLLRSIEDLYGNTVKSYDNYTIESTSQHTTTLLSPNIGDGTFLIKGEISTDCVDTDSSDNHVEKLISILPPTFSSNYSTVFISEFLANPAGDDNAAMPSGEWIEFYNSGDFAIDLENVTIFDNLGSTADITISQTNTLNTTVIEPNGYLVVYTNGNLVLNNEGFEKISVYSDSGLIDSVSYDGSSEDVSWSKIGGVWIQTPPTPERSNFHSQTLLESNLDIVDLYDLGTDDKIKFGQSIRVKLSLYKGDETKNVVTLWAGRSETKISKVVQITLPEKFTNTTITVPLQIVTNCARAFDEGYYKIYLGWISESYETETDILIVNDDCKEILSTQTVVQETTSASLQEFEQEVISSKQTSSILFTSSNQKAVNLSSYVIIFVLLLGYFMFMFY